MEFQSERVPGVEMNMCSNVESMARDGSFYNFNSRGSSTPYSEHGLCRQTESHNGGTIAPQRSTERAAIFSAANGTTRGEHSQQPFQTTWAWRARQADIGGLRKQWEEEWTTELEKKKTGTRSGSKTTKERIIGEVKTVQRTRGKSGENRVEYP